MDKLLSLVAHTPIRDMVMKLAETSPAIVCDLTQIFTKLVEDEYYFAPVKDKHSTEISSSEKGFASSVTNPDPLNYAANILARVAPPLDGSGHKGQGGRIGVLGGSIDYTGAPFYTGMSALGVGAELLYLFTEKEAATPIKCYSPELMVSSVYRMSEIAPFSCEENASKVRAEQERMVLRVQSMFPKLHALVIGPGLGRDPNVLNAAGEIITAARSAGVPLIIDADGLFLVSKQPHLVKGHQGVVVLTPNVRECAILAQAVVKDANAPLEEIAKALDGPIILRKGPFDEICGQSGRVHTVAVSGAPRRPGGLGDILAGAVSTLVGWTVSKNSSHVDEAAIVQACHAASTIVRRACIAAYSEKFRAMMAPDVLKKLFVAFDDLHPAPRL